MGQVCSICTSDDVVVSQHSNMERRAKLKQGPVGDFILTPKDG